MKWEFERVRALKYLEVKVGREDCDQSHVCVLALRRVTRSDYFLARCSGFLCVEYTRKMQLQRLSVFTGW